MLTPCQRLSGGRGAEAERIGGAEAEPPTARATAEGLRRGKGITHADMMHQEPPRAPTGAQERHTLPEVRGAALSPSHAHSPTRRATGHDRRHRVRSIHPPHTMPTEGAQMPHRGRSGARGTATHPQRQEEPQPPRMSRRGCEVHLFEYGDGAQPQSRKAARRKG